jgi:hypothetical protein
MVETLQVKTPEVPGREGDSASADKVVTKTVMRILYALTLLYGTMYAEFRGSP